MKIGEKREEKEGHRGEIGQKEIKEKR